MIYKGIEYSVSDTNIHITKSYAVTNDNEKRKFIRHLLETTAMKRSENSLLNEWKGHNAFYQRGWWIDHTADVDLEFKQNFFLKIVWWLVAHLFKEELL